MRRNQWEALLPFFVWSLLLGGWVGSSLGAEPALIPFERVPVVQAGDQLRADGLAKLPTAALATSTQSQVPVSGVDTNLARDHRLQAVPGMVPVGPFRYPADLTLEPVGSLEPTGVLPVFPLRRPHPTELAPEISVAVGGPQQSRMVLDVEGQVAPAGGPLPHHLHR